MLKRILIGLGILIVVIVAGAYALPRQVHVERSIVVDAPPDFVFDFLNSFERANEWSPWAEKDPDMEVTYSGPASGVGATMAWRSDKREVGTGSQTITTSEPTQYIRTKLSFEGQGDAASFFNITRVHDGTEIVWGFETDTGMNPLCRYTGLLMDRWVGKDFEHGLAKLKTVVESNN